MRSIIMLAVASATTLVAPLAFAAEATGRIVSENASAHTITLQGGETFSLPARFNDPSVTTGAEVKVVFDTMNGKNIASDVMAYPSSHGKK